MWDRRQFSVGFINKKNSTFLQRHDAFWRLPCYKKEALLNFLSRPDPHGEATFKSIKSFMGVSVERRRGNSWTSFVHQRDPNRRSYTDDPELGWELNLTEDQFLAEESKTLWRFDSEQFKTLFMEEKLERIGGKMLNDSKERSLEMIKFVEKQMDDHNSNADEVQDFKKAVCYIEKNCQPSLRDSGGKNREKASDDTNNDKKATSSSIGASSSISKNAITESEIRKIIANTTKEVLELQGDKINGKLSGILHEHRADTSERKKYWSEQNDLPRKKRSNSAPSNCSRSRSREHRNKTHRRRSEYDGEQSYNRYGQYGRPEPNRCDAGHHRGEKNYDYGSNGNYNSDYWSSEKYPDYRRRDDYFEDRYSKNNSKWSNEKADYGHNDRWYGHGASSRKDYNKYNNGSIDKNSQRGWGNNSNARNKADHDFRKKKQEDGRGKNTPRSSSKIRMPSRNGDNREGNAAEEVDVIECESSDSNRRRSKVGGTGGEDEFSDSESGDRDSEGRKKILEEKSEHSSEIVARPAKN